jgi:hypothetical protein
MAKVMPTIRALPLLALFIGGDALACSIPPVESGWGKEQLVARTSTIVLVEVAEKKEVSRHETRWVFRTLRPLKGAPSASFEVTLPNAPDSYIEVDFSEHTDREFWEGSYGRLPWVPGPCTPRYTFELAGQYLLFVEALNNGASAERIKSKEDKWLLYVQERVQRKP